MSIKIMTWVWENSTETGTALLLLLAIADHANDDGVCWPSLARLAQRARVCERQAQRLVTQLEQSGALEIQRGRGRKKTSIYIIKGAPDCTINVPEKVTSRARKGDIQGKEKVTSRDKKGDIAMSPDPSLDPSIEPGSTPASPPPPAESSNSYFGMQRPIRRERVIADGYTQDAAKLGVDAPTFVAIFNALIDAAGWRALVDAGDDSKLNYAKQDGLALIRMGNTTPEHIMALADAYMKANTWRTSPPQPKDLAEYASQLQAGVLREKQENRPPSGREIVTVKFAKPGDDIYA